MYEDRGARTWMLEVLGFEGSVAAQADEALLVPEDDDASFRDDDGRVRPEWYESKLEALRALATHRLSQPYRTPREHEGDAFIDEDVAVTLLGIADHFECEHDLNYGGDYTYVRASSPDSELFRLTAACNEVRMRAAAGDSGAISAMARWSADLHAFEYFLRALVGRRIATLVLLLEARM